MDKGFGRTWAQVVRSLQRIERNLGPLSEREFWWLVENILSARVGADNG